MDFIIGQHKCLIDDEDLHIVHGRKWSVQTSGRSFRALAWVDGQAKLMHRLIWEARFGAIPADRVIDHINANALDNRKANLRLATRSQNMWNRPKHSTSVFKGVSRSGNRWKVYFRHNKKFVYGGTFDTPEQAHAKYQSMIQQLCGEFARAQ